MKKSWSRVFAILFAVLASLYTSTNIVAVGNRDERKTVPQDSRSALLERLERKADASGFIDIIISLHTTNDFPISRRIPTDEIWKRKLKEYQDNFLKKLEGYRVERVDKFEIFPFISMRIDSRTLKVLQGFREVKNIQGNEFIDADLLESNSIIGTPAAHNNGFTGQGVTIAVIDSGIDKNHPFLAGKVVSEACYSTNDPSQNVSSLCPDGVTESTALDSGLNCSLAILGCEHGTHVAGIAAGRDLAGTIYGVAKNASLIAIKAASAQQISQGKKARYSSFDVIKGLQRVYVLRDDFHIASVNISLGGGQYNSASSCDSDNSMYKEAIDDLRQVGIATIIASGNEHFSTALASPACVSSAISVGSTDDGSEGTIVDTISGFSNSASFLSLLAPGQWITSSVPNGNYSDLGGTSQAAPHVAGAWAVLKQKKLNASVEEILGALKSSGKPILDFRNNVAVPRIRVDLALQKLRPDFYSPTYFIWTETPQLQYSIGGLQVIYKVKANRTFRRQIINFSVSGFTNNISGSFSDSSVPCSLKSLCETNLVVNIPRSTPVGNYSLTVTGKGPLGTSSVELVVHASLLLEAVLFYDANSPNISFREPVVDSQGNLILVSSHSAGSCSPGTCGNRLNSISPSGALNWQTPGNGGFISPTSTRYWAPVLGPDNSIYVPVLDSVLCAFNSNGATVGNFPVSIAPAGTINWQFPGTSPVLVDQATGSIYASAAQTSSFDNFPNRITALNPNGSEQWHVDYPNHARSSAAGNLVQGPQQDIYTFLFTNSSARFTRLNKANGNIVCDISTITGSERVGGDDRGIFTDYRTELQVFNSTCNSNAIYNNPDRFIEFRKYDQGTIYAIDFPVIGSDPNRLLAISSTGVLLWESQDIVPHPAVQPVRAVKNNIAYILAFDGSDYNKTKLFAVNSQTGSILSRVDTSSICGLGCGVAVSNTGQVYLSFADKIYKVTAN